MATAFTGSRLANLREKKNSSHEDGLNLQGEFKLTLPDQDEKSTYQPTSTFSNTRTSMRLLKGKIDRGQSNDKGEIRSGGNLQSNTQTKLTLLPEKQEDMKLVLNDEPQFVQKKVSQEQTVKPNPKRIMIAREPSKQESNKELPPPKQEETAKVVKKQEVPKQQQKQQSKQYINPHDQKPIIKEEDIEQSKDQPENENDLVMCPEGCGRKFNRKALEKHAKACKIVFMSKRKQFNSEAKRISTKEQANLVKQNKQKEKTQFGKSKSKGFQKTGDNWKAASEDFRAAIKAIKKDDDEQEQVDTGLLNQEGQPEKNPALNLVPCEFCQKMFAQVLIEKHLQNCVKKKEKESKVVKKGGAAIKKK